MCQRRISNKNVARAVGKKFYYHSDFIMPNLQKRHIDDHRPTIKKTHSRIESGGGKKKPPGRMILIFGSPRFAIS